MKDAVDFQKSGIVKIIVILIPRAWSLTENRVFGAHFPAKPWAPPNDRYLNLTADEWGPLKASFDLHRSPIATWPDLGAFTCKDIRP